MNKNLIIKIIAVAAGIFILFAVAIYLLSQTLIMNGFYKIEENDYAEKMQVITNSIKKDEARLQGTARDWSFWDSIYNFPTDPNSDFVETQILEDELDNLNIDYFAVLNSNFELFYILTRGPDGKDVTNEVDPILKQQIIESAKLYQSQTKNISDIKNLYFDNNGVLTLNATSNILQNDQTGPSHGYLQIGQFYNDEMMKTLDEDTKLDLSIKSYEAFKSKEPKIADSLLKNDTTIIFTNAKNADGYYLLRDYNNKPTSVITSHFTRNINSTAVSSRNYYIGAIYTTSIVAIAIAVFIFLRLAISRQKQLQGEKKYELLFNENVMPLLLIKIDKNWGWNLIVEQNNAAMNLYRDNDWLDIKSKPINVLYGMDGIQIKDFISPLISVGLSTVQTELVFGQAKLGVEIVGRIFKIAEEKYLLLSIKDLSERIGYEKRLEDYASNLKKFQLAVENASDQIVITDPEGVILYANKSLEMTSGFSVEEAIGKKAGSSELGGGMMDRDYYDKMWKTINTEKQSFIGELKNKRKDGQEYDAALSISPILDEGNRVIFFVGIERDITKAKEVDRAKTEFVSLASHQLRTPLSSINWFTEMLLNGDAGETNSTQKEYLNEIYKGNKRMVGLVNALLNASRIELGTFGVEPEPADIIAISKDVIEELVPLIKEKQVYVVEDYDEMPQILLDPKLTRIIFQNLMTNAIKYTGGRGKITVSIKKDSDNVIISVADTGFGIPLKQQEKIFSKLFRADNIKALDAEGSGLGLYIVKSIVEESNGKIWFESEENKGTTFHVSLPINGMKERAGSKPLE